MRILLKLEELALFLWCLLFLVALRVDWWVYPLLLLGPDISMLGYLINPRVGAFTYNLFHHKGVGLLLMGYAFLRMAMDVHGYDIRSGALIAGIVLLGHSSLDRMLGYGLKFGDHFQHTHLGWIGNAKGLHTPE